MWCTILFASMLLHPSEEGCLMIRIRSPKSRRPNSWDPLKVQLDNWNAIYMATQQLVSYGRQKFESFLNGGTIGTGFRLGVLICTENYCCSCWFVSVTQRWQARLKISINCGQDCTTNQFGGSNVIAWSSLPWMHSTSSTNKQEDRGGEPKIL